MKQGFTKAKMLTVFTFCLKKSLSKPTLFSLILMATFEFAFSHGTVTYPPSRVWICFQENPESPDSPACIDAVASHGTQPLYDWSEINQPNANGQHTQLVMNGNLASGGRPNKYGGMDQVRSDWVTTYVSPGPFTITWSILAPHATEYFDVYITNADWTPDQPLTWNSLTLLTSTPPSGLATSVDIPVTLPYRTGKHVIYSVWQRSLSPEAFYSASDIDFGTTPIEQLNKPSSFVLKQSYPNPFDQTTKIGYSLSKDEFVTLKVYDICGKEVSTLVSGYQAPGEYEATFSGENLNSGVYIYELQAGDHTESKRMVLIK